MAAQTTDASSEMHRGDLDVRPIDRDEAKAIVLPNHYSGTWNTLFGRFNLGVFDDDGLCGAAVFGHLMNPKSANSIAELPNGAIVELNRLWVDDRMSRNTETALLSRCFKWLRANTNVELIQSFADGRLGCGTVYKAANFSYHGAERSRFFVDRRTGATTHAVQLTNTAKMRAMILLNEAWVDGHLHTFEVLTYRYLYPLTKRARRAIKLPALPYPAYSKGVIETPDYVMPLGQIARCVLACEARGDRVRARKFRDHIESQAKPDTVAQLMADAAHNEWVAGMSEAARLQPALFDLGDTA